MRATARSGNGRCSRADVWGDVSSRGAPWVIHFPRHSPTMNNPMIMLDQGEKGQELDLMTLVGPFQLRTFHHSVITSESCYHAIFSTKKLMDGLLCIHITSLNTADH